ncbi:MAG TPA: hypothetical protein DCP71_04445 [Verrucomicrobiales bacterium]|nr:hypothetical protein [Verrucomicrobiales bacterium]
MARVFPTVCTSPGLFGFILMSLLVTLGHLRADDPGPGMADTSFNGTGYVTLTHTSVNSLLKPMIALTPEGKTILASARKKVGSSTWEFIIQRLQVNGALDTDFGNAGISIVPVPAEFEATSMVDACVLPDGRIVVAATLWTVIATTPSQQTASHSALLYIPEAGLPDSTNVPGVLSIGVRYSQVKDLTLDLDGNLLVLVNLRSQSSGLPTLSAYRVWLTTPRPVGADSAVVSVPSSLNLPINTHSYGTQIAVLPSGEIYVGGYTSNGRPLLLVSTPYPWGRSIQGTLFEDGSVGSIVCLAVDSQGMLLATRIRRTSIDSNSASLQILRFKMSLLKDELFGQSGEMTLMSSFSSHQLDMATQPDGRILVAVKDGPGWDGVYRLTTTGTLDLSFSSTGFRYIQSSEDSWHTNFHHMRVYTDGKIVIVDHSTSYDTGTWTVARVHSGMPLREGQPVITSQPAAYHPIPVGQTFSYQATFTGSPPFHYFLTENSQVVASGITTEGSFTRTQGVVDAVYRFSVGNANGWTVSTTVSTRALSPPVLNYDFGPEPYPNTDYLYAYPFQTWIRVSGRAPMTYRLMAGDREVQSGTVENGTIDMRLRNTALHELIVTNSDGETRSGLFDVTPQNDPYVTLGDDRLFYSGTTGHFFTRSCTMSEEYTLTHYRNGKLVESSYVPYSDWRKFHLPEKLTLADAATFTARIRTPRKSFTSKPVEVCIVDPAAQSQYMAVGKKVNIVAPVAGKGLRYVWKKQNEPITPSQRIPKVDQATLSITNAEEEDAAVYTCVVTNSSGQALETGPITLVKDEAVPTFSITELEGAALGGTYVFDLNSENRTGSFTMSGLPPGLIYNKTTGLITGQPMKAGTYQVKVVATNAAGSAPSRNFKLVVSPLPHPISGAYQVMEKTTYGLDGWSVTGKVTVNASASFSARLRGSNLQGKTFSRTIAGVFTWDASLQKYIYSSPELDIDPESTKSYTNWHFTLDPLGGAAAEMPLQGSIDIENGLFIYLQGTRPAPTAAAAPHAGYYTAKIDILNDTYGYTTFTVTPKGTLILAGKLPDGTALTASTAVDEKGRFPISLSLYSGRGRVKLLGQIHPGANGDARNATVISNELAWTRPPFRKAGEPDDHGSNNPFHQGVDTTGILRGSKYLPPNITDVSSSLMMNIAANQPGNVTIILSGYSLGLNASGHLTAKHSLVIPRRVGKPIYENFDPIYMTSLTFNAAKGTFTAGASMDNFHGETNAFTRTQKHRFQGVVTRDPETLNPTAWGFTVWTVKIFNDYTMKTYNELRSEGIRVIPR